MTAPQAELQKALDGMTKDSARVSGHEIEGLPVIFNPSAPAHRFLCIGLGPLNVTGGLELHCDAEAFGEFEQREDVRRAVIRMLVMIKEGLRRNRARFGAHNN